MLCFCCCGDNKDERVENARFKVWTAFGMHRRVLRCKLCPAVTATALNNSTPFYCTDFKPVNSTHYFQPGS